MSTDLLLVLSLLGLAVAMFVVNKPRADAVALLMIVALPLTGVIDISEAIAGFSDRNIVLVAALFVLGEGLVRTGVAQHLGDWLVRKGAGSETRLLILLMLTVAAIGSVMSSTGVVAIFIPIVLRIAMKTGTSPSKLMMPLSMAALLSGTLTLVATTPNLMLHSELIRSGATGFSFFSFTPFGIPLLTLGILYMLFARRWLGSATPASLALGKRASLVDWIERYHLAGREHRLRVSPGSALVGRKISDLHLRTRSGATILAVERRHRFSKELIFPKPNTELQAGDILMVDISSTGIKAQELCEQFALNAMPLTGTYFTDAVQEVGMAEIMIPATSELIGKTIIELRFRSEYELTVLGLKHGSKAQDRNVRDEKLSIGDTLLVTGSWRAIRRLRAHSDNLMLLNLPEEFDSVLPAAGRAPYAIGCLLLVIVLMATGILPNVQAAIIGCLLMGLFRCIDFESAYRAIHWKTMVLIVGMLPFALALERTGGVDMAAAGVISVFGESSPHLLLACLFSITIIMGLFINGTANAVLMAPVALSIAKALQASPYPFAMTVALAASCAFASPLSTPVNMLVMGPGNYRFKDFIRVGVPFILIVMLVCSWLVPWVMPLY